MAGERVFDGLKVLDCASFIAAPAAATILSDFGADVIKIEPPRTGDPFRHLPKMPGSPVSEHNYAWLLEGRNRRSLALDLSKEEGRTVLRRLVEQTDVFVTNFPAVVRKKLGVRYEDLSPLNDRLIYASFTGYGERGPEANLPGYDMTCWWARSGLMDVARYDAQSPPARAAAGMGDHPSAVALYAAIATALYQRERTGRGMQVGSSLLANGAWANAYSVQAALCGAKFIDRPPREKALNALSNYYQTRDKRWLILTFVNEDRLWPSFAKAIGRPELIEAPLFATKKDRHANARALTAILDQTFATKDLAEWKRTLSEAGDLTFDIVVTPAEAAADPQMAVNDIFVPIEGQELRTVNSPFYVGDYEKAQPRLAPEIGAQTDEVLRSAGFGEGEIKQLREQGAVA